jgi:hypothetical protein
MRAAYLYGMHCAVLLTGCFVAQAGQLADDPDAPWIPGLPISNSFAGIVELDSDPSGAEATTSLGGACRTPCSLEVSAEGPFTVTFTHEGYESSTVEVKIQHARMGVSERKFAPNPVVAQLAAVAKAPPPAPAKKTVATAPPQPPKAAPRKPVAAAQPAAPPAPARSASPAEVKPIAGINSGPTVPPDAARSNAQPPQPASGKPVAAGQPAAPPAPAQSGWPAEVKPIAGINSGPIVPAVAPRSSDAVARRWLENFDKPAPDPAPDKK